MSARAAVDVDDGTEVGVGGGVVDQDVDGAEALDGGLDAGGGLLGLAGVGHEPSHPVRRAPAVRLGQLGCRRHQALLAAGGDHDRRPRLDEGVGNGSTDSTRATGDQRRPAVEPELHPGDSMHHGGADPGSSADGHRLGNP